MHSVRWLISAAFAVCLAVIAIACGSSDAGSAPAAPSTAPAPTVTSVSVSGATPVLGTSSQFTATAAFSNGSTQAVTSQATWTSSSVSIATVTNSGLVTATGAGEADINATYQAISGKSHVSVTKPVTSTYTLSGAVTDGTSGGLLPNIGIEVSDTVGNAKSATTSNVGAYVVTGLSAGSFTTTASATGYQTTSRAVAVSADARLDIVLPRSVSNPTPAPTPELKCNGASAPSTVSCPNNQGIQAPTALCRDDTYSCSQNRSGTCSSHGGVQCYVCPGPLC